MDKGAFDISNIDGIAIDTAGAMLESAEAVIDTQFGTGYAEKHPVIVAGFVQACALVYFADRVSVALESLHPDAPLRLDGIGAEGRLDG